MSSCAQIRCCCYWLGAQSQRELAGKSTLNRLELAGERDVGDRYKKVHYDGAKIDELLVKIFLEARGNAPEEIVIDLDATDLPVHGHQEQRFFHGYYNHYCYLPLYIVCGDHLLGVRLRPSNIDASADSLEEIERIVRQIRQSWPQVKIILRADSGFCRDTLMSWCEANQVDYVLGFCPERTFAADHRAADAASRSPASGNQPAGPCLYRVYVRNSR